MATVVRVVKNCNYTTLSNYHFKDKRLSWKAKGLLSTMLSLPPDWNYTIEGLAALSGDGTKSTNSGLAELERYGYLKRKQLRDGNGHFSLTEYTIYEEPIEMEEPSFEEQELDETLAIQDENTPLCQNGQTVENKAFSPLCQKRQTEKRFAEKGVQLNTNILNTKELNTYNSSSSTSTNEEKYATSHKHEEEYLRERIKINALRKIYSAELVEVVFLELCKRDKEFQNLMTAEAMEELCSAVMRKQQQEPIRMLPNFVNRCLDNIIHGIKVSSSREKMLEPKNSGKNRFNQFEQRDYSDDDFEELERILLRN